MSKISVQYRITKSNSHLTDIFLRNAYYKCGVIDDSTINLLLSHKIIDIHLLVDFKFQKFFITTHNELVVDDFPFFYFQTISKQDSNYKTFLTFGLIKGGNVGSEIFTPIILIPIVIYNENRCFRVVNDLPIMINPLIFTMYTQIKQFQYTAKIENLYDIGIFFHELSSRGLKISYENYITYAEIEETTNVVYDNNLFNYQIDYSEKLDKELFEDKNFYLKMLNFDQRQIVFNILNGNNIMVTGPQGTGKTTCLLTAAINLIHKGKRVLYINDDENEILNLISLLNDLGISNKIANLSIAFDTLLKPKTSIHVDDNVSSIIHDIDYNRFYNLEKEYNSKVLNYRYAQILENLIFEDDIKPQLLDITNLDIYSKEEFFVIYQAIVKVEESFKLMGSLNENPWRKIPLFRSPTNAIDKSELLENIMLIKNEFDNVVCCLNSLETNYNIIKPFCLTQAKYTINNICNLTNIIIPNHWIDSDVDLDEILFMYNHLSNSIRSVLDKQTIYETLYFNKDNIDILGECEFVLSLLNDNLTITNIDNINKEKTYLFDAQRLYTDAYVSFKKYYKIISRDLNLDSTINHNIINLLKSLELVLNNLSFPYDTIKKMFNINNTNINNIIKKTLVKRNKLEININQIIKFIGEEKNIKKSFNALSFILNKQTNKERIDKQLLRFYRNESLENNKTFYESCLKYFDLVQQIEDCDKKIIEYINGNGIYETFFSFVKNALNLYDIQDNYNIIDHVIKLVDDETKLKDLKSFLIILNTNISEIYAYKDCVIGFGFKVDNEFSLMCDKLKQISINIKKLLISNLRMKNVMRNSLNSFVSFKDYQDIYNKYFDYSEALKALVENDKYPLFFSEYYQSVKTDLTLLSDIIKRYNEFYNCFNSKKDIVAVIKNNLLKDFDNCFSQTNLALTHIDHLLKTFSKYFKGEESLIYYKSFNIVLEYFNNLLNNVSKLDYYILLMEACLVLSNYKLTKIVNMIISKDKVDNLAINFKYTYFKSLENLYKTKYPLVNDVDIEEVINKIIDLESENLNTHANNIIKSLASSSNIKIEQLKFFSYTSYLKKTKNKELLVFSNSLIANRFIDLELFDCVIVDDSHILSLNNQNKYLTSKQIIIASEVYRYGKTLSLISTALKHSSAYKLSFKYNTSPKSLMSYKKIPKGVIYDNERDNKGVEFVCSVDIGETIKSILNEDINSKFNIVLLNIDKAYYVLDQIFRVLDPHIDRYDFISKRINFVLTNYLRVLNADYNIVYVDYFEKQMSHEKLINIIDSITNINKSIILVTEKKRFDTNNSLYLSIKNDIANKLVFNKVLGNDISYKLSKAFEKKKCELMYGNNMLDYYIKKGNKIYGLIVLPDMLVARGSLLNLYRDIRSSKLKCYILWLSNCSNSLNKEVLRILRKIKNENS